MSERLNLAATPFRNERLPGLLFSLALVALFGITIRHASLVVRLMPSRTSASQELARALEAEAAELRRSSASLRGPGPDRATLARWAAVKELVDQRAFSWTDLLARLESTLASDVRLLSVAPTREKDGWRLRLGASARDAEAGFALVRALEERPDFEDVLPTSKNPRDDGFEFQYEMRYRPEAVPQAPSRNPSKDGEP